MTYVYVPGYGYTVRAADGRVIGRGLTTRQRDTLLREGVSAVLTADTLREILGAS